MTRTKFDDTVRLSDLLPHVETGYESRYAGNWKTIAGETAAQVDGFCCYRDCWQRGAAVHHAMYREEGEPIAGVEVPGVHVFLLCKFHHGKGRQGRNSQRNAECAHYPANWFPGVLPPPTLDARNSDAYYLKLREGWIQKRQWKKRKDGN